MGSIQVFAGSIPLILLFTATNTDWLRDVCLYACSSAQFDWYTGSNGTSMMTLKLVGLCLSATFVSARYNRLQFNEKPLVNALDVSRNLEQV